MTDMTIHTGGCLCGAVRYEAEGQPSYAGMCCCADCRKASGSGFVGFLSWPASRLRIRGDTLKFRSPSFRGTEALRNSCVVCGSLVFGGEVGVHADHTIYAGSLDDPTVFKPTMLLFNRDRPDWVVVPDGVTVFETMPG